MQNSLSAPHASRVPFQYHLLAYRKDQLWLPGAMWALFAFLSVALRSTPLERARLSVAFLAFVLPLLAGIMAATCLLDDPALELQLAAPRRPRRILLEGLLMLGSILAAGALAYQVFVLLVGVDLSPYGSLAQRQLLWLAPGLFMLGLGSLAAMLAAHSMGGTLLAGLVWLAQVVLHDWFAANAVTRYAFLFAGFFQPGASYLNRTALVLAALGIVFTGLAWQALERQERYL